MEQRDPRTYAIIGAAIEVHRQLGYGFVEGVYQEALELELAARGIPFERQVPVPVHYKGQLLETIYRADLICYGSVLVELKALSRLSGVERAQVLNYLKATGLEVALLIDFGAPSLEHERLAFTHPQSAKAAKAADSPSGPERQA